VSISPLILKNYIKVLLQIILMNSTRRDLSIGISHAAIQLKMDEIDFWEKLKNRHLINFPL